MSYSMSRKHPCIVNNSPFNSYCRFSTIWMRKEKKIWRNDTGTAKALSSLNDNLRKADAWFCLSTLFQLCPLSQQYLCLNILFLCLLSLFPEARNAGLTLWPCSPIVLYTSRCSGGPLSSHQESHQLSLMMAWVAAIVVLGPFSRGEHCHFCVCQLPIFCQDTGPHLVSLVSELALLWEVVLTVPAMSMGVTMAALGQKPVGRPLPVLPEVRHVPGSGSQLAGLGVPPSREIVLFSFRPPEDMDGPPQAELCELPGWSPWSILGAHPCGLLGGWCGLGAPFLPVVSQMLLDFIES